jgi:vancomycin permeability regulator SanA
MGRQSQAETRCNRLKRHETGRHKIQEIMRTQRTQRWKRGRIFVAVLVVWVVLHIVYITIDGLSGYSGSADMAVVLGNRVDADGSLSPVLKGRVDRALTLYRQGRIARIMVSGGLGLQAGHYPEGKAMKEYLVAQGVPADRIIEDDHGENTYLTAMDLLPVADSLHVHSVIAVSSFYHLTRTKYIIRKVGFHGAVHGDASQAFFWADFVGIPRDAVAFYKYLIVY